MAASADWWEELGMDVALFSEGVKTLTELAEKHAKEALQVQFPEVDLSRNLTANWGNDSPA